MKKTKVKTIVKKRRIKGRLLVIFWPNQTQLASASEAHLWRLCCGHQLAIRDDCQREKVKATMSRAGFEIVFFIKWSDKCHLENSYSYAHITEPKMSNWFLSPL